MSPLGDHPTPAHHRRATLHPTSASLTETARAAFGDHAGRAHGTVDGEGA
ncbi:DUF6380 family protein [Streptomyces sp. NPDC091292]